MVFNHQIWKPQGTLEVTQAHCLIFGAQTKWPYADVCLQCGRLQRAPGVRRCAFHTTHLSVAHPLMNMKWGRKWHFRSTWTFSCCTNLTCCFPIGRALWAILSWGSIVTYWLTEAFRVLSKVHLIISHPVHLWSLWLCVTERSGTLTLRRFIIWNDVERSVGRYLFWKVLLKML